MCELNWFMMEFDNKFFIICEESASITAQHFLTNCVTITVSQGMSFVVFLLYIKQKLNLTFNNAL
jgi:hypothetical protein